MLPELILPFEPCLLKEPYFSGIACTSLDAALLNFGTMCGSNSSFDGSIVTSYMAASLKLHTMRDTDTSLVGSVDTSL